MFLRKRKNDILPVIYTGKKTLTECSRFYLSVHFSNYVLFIDFAQYRMLDELHALNRAKETCKLYRETDISTCHSFKLSF